MLTQQVALVSEIQGFDFSALTSVSAALQKQVTRDVAPIWGVQSTVDAFQSLDDVPLGYWPLIVTNQPLGNAAGVHMDQDGQPYALVEVSDSWSLTASHECLEMLVDPYGNRTIAGPSPKADQGRVEFLVEVCDPCEDAAFAYTVNDVLVSDFYTPHFFDPTAGDNVAYSFSQAIPAPRQVLNNGYLSWHDPVADQWWQRTMFNGEQQDRNLGAITNRGERSLREWINGKTPQHLEATRLKKGHPVLQHAVGRQLQSRHAAGAKAKRLRARVAQLAQR
jgi:hypothetical protein